MYIKPAVLTKHLSKLENIVKISNGFLSCLKGYFNKLQFKKNLTLEAHRSLSNTWFVTTVWLKEKCTNQNRVNSYLLQQKSSIFKTTLQDVKGPRFLIASFWQCNPFIIFTNSISENFVFNCYGEKTNLLEHESSIYFLLGKSINRQWMGKGQVLCLFFL